MRLKFKLIIKNKAIHLKKYEIKQYSDVSIIKKTIVVKKKRKLKKNISKLHINFFFLVLKNTIINNLTKVLKKTITKF